MPVSVKLPNEFQGIYKHIFKSNPEKGTMQLVIHELRRRLAEYRLMEKKLHNKYNMAFEEFKSKKIVEESDRSFEVEEDFCDWELALDGIDTINNELKKIAKYT
ncbi:MAG: hypothetical protein K8R17_03460 [Methanosarcinales archaeon]|nr:hypothetical protein [Methanosarcinales archaeon]